MEHWKAIREECRRIEEARSQGRADYENIGLAIRDLERLSERAKRQGPIFAEIVVPSIDDVLKVLRAIRERM